MFGRSSIFVIALVYYHHGHLYSGFPLLNNFIYLFKISAEIAATLRENKLHLFTCICALSPSLSIKISLRFLVPIMFRKEVWASSLVEPCASSTLVTDTVAFWILKYTTASTVTVTLSRVRA